MNDKPKKRVLIVQNELPHYRQPLFRKLGQRYSLTVAHSGGPTPIRTTGYEEILAPKRQIGSFQLQPSLFEHLNRAAYDVVIVMFDLRWPLGLLPAFRRRPYRYLLWGHRYSHRAVANQIRQAVMRRVDGHILYGEADIERMVSSGIRRESIYVAHNTIHVANHCDCSNAPKSTFLFVGRAQTRKRVDHLIRAFAAIVSLVPKDFVVEIVGSGNENTRLMDLAALCGIGDRVIFRGEITDAVALKECYSRALAYVSPGDVGLGVLHSFAYGVPLITAAHAHHGPEAENLKDGVNCILFEHDHDLASSMLALVNDRMLAARLGANAYRLYSEERSMDLMVRAFVSAIEAE